MSKSGCRLEIIGHKAHTQVDVAKRAGRVGLIGFAGQLGRGSKQVIFKWVNQVVGQSGCESSRVAGQVELTCIFQTSF